MPEKDIKLGAGTLREQIAGLPDQDLKAIFDQSNNWAAYQRETGLMEGVAKFMMETPDVAMNVAESKDFNPLIKVESPDEGGVLTYMQKFERPYRGFPYHAFVDRIDMVKKVMRSFISGIFHELKGTSKWKFLTLLPAAWSSRHLVRAGVFTFSRIVERFRVKPNCYSVAVRELHRVLSIERDWEKQNDRAFRQHFRDAICMLLEFDNAYRFRFQDIVPEVVKGNKNVRKELVRLISIMQGREKEQQVRDTWTLVTLMVKYYLIFDKNFERLLGDVLRDIDVEKVKISLDDMQYCLTRKDYVFGITLGNVGVDAARIMAIVELDREREEKISAIRKESTQSHADLAKRHESTPVKEGEDRQKEIEELDLKYTIKLEKVEAEYKDMRFKLNPST